MSAILAGLIEYPVFNYCKILESGGNCVNYASYFDEGSENPILHFGWVIIIAKLCGKNVIAICSDHAFKHFRYDGSNLLVYQHCQNVSSENSLVIGVAGFAIFHHLNQVNGNELIWASNELLNPLSEETILSLSAPRIRHNPIGLNNEIHNGEEIAENESTDDENNIVDDVVGIEIDGDLETAGESDTLEPSEISLQSACNAIQFTTAEMFLSSSQRINFDLESNLTQISEDSPLDQTFDIDGVFIAMSIEEIKHNLKCPLTLLRNPKRADKRNVQNFVKNYLNSPIVIPRDIEMFRIGYLGTDFGKFDVYLYHGIDPIIGTDEDHNRLMRIDRYRLFKDCIDYSKTFPCDSCAEHGPVCHSHQYRAQRESHIPISGFSEDFIPIPLIKCFFHHFEVKLNRLLFVENVISGFYLRAIGTKNSLVTNSSENFYLNLEKITSYVEINSLSRESIAFDFCIQTVKRGEIPVSHLLLNLH